MSSPIQADEDEVEEVEFVSEGTSRPVLECIDLLSESEDEGCSSLAGTIEDKINCHKAQVASTLDRLAHQVALEKKERANKCRAFKEKQILQKAHGQQELAYGSTNGINQEAKRCVDMWLKMPGLQPGVIHAGFGRRHRPASFPRNSSTTHTCPVINCGRVYDNASLLDGHLKRFDHSPCDPTINLKGSPSDLFACAACGQHFQTKEAWRRHLESKVSSSTADGHSITQTYQRIVCFACPACYLLFNLRDECLQHMSAQNHFTESLAMNESRGRALPVPIPTYVKGRLIALCKDTSFNVRCSLCHKVLISHQAAQAHFNVYCRQGCAVAKADKTISQVMKQLQVRGQCSLCCEIFLSQAEIERHKESTQHDVEVNQTMEKAVLQYCRFSEIQHTQRARQAQGERKSTGLETSFQKRNKKRSICEDFPAKRQRLSQSVNGGASRNSVTAWYCECGLHFSEEAAASKHLLAVNQIFHQCGVCGKHMGESSITRLHMSRFHGGAHLSNFLFYCRKCKVEMPRYQDILSHVSDAHSGHTYYTEQEMPEELAVVIDAKPSTSSEVTLQSSSKSAVQQNAPIKAARTWMCRMCEDIFDSEAAVREHCSDVSSHNYQRFICGHCPQKFFKESTVRRHCINEHDGQIKSSHFCGLCDSMQFGSEAEFLEHYKSLHSKDYYAMDDVEVVQPAVAEITSQLTCPCMGSEKSKEEMKATYTQCMRDLATEGKCQYVCAPCGVSVPSYAQMKTHVYTKHPALNLDKTFDVGCKACQESFTDVPTFHKHYHSRHCTLEPCMSSRTCSKDMKAEPTSVKILNAVEINPDTNEIEDETLVKFLNMDQANKESETRENESDEDKTAALPSVSVSFPRVSPGGINPRSLGQKSLNGGKTLPAPSPLLHPQGSSRPASIVNSTGAIISKSQTNLVEAFNKILNNKNLLPCYKPDLSSPLPAEWGLPLPAQGYRCLECGDAFALEQSLARHYARRSLRIEVTCNHCAKRLAFFNKCSLLLHAREHKERGLIMQCSHLVMKPVPVEQMIGLQEPTAIGGLSPSLLSPSSGPSSSSIVQATPNPTPQPQKAVSNKKAEALLYSGNKCPECQAQFSRKEEVAEHFQEIKPPQTTSCTECSPPMLLPNSCSAAAHQRIHQGSPPHVCPECGGTAKQPLFQTHLDETCLHFSRRIGYRCSSCLVVFGGLNSVKSHIQQAHCDIFHKCPSCPMAFKSAPSIQTHINAQHPTLTEGQTMLIYKCVMCDTVFTNKPLLYVHFDTHLTNQKVHVFKCPECTKLFSQRNSLLDHFKTHKAPTLKQELPSPPAPSSRSRPTLKLESSDGEEWIDEDKEEKVKTERMKTPSGWKCAPCHARYTDREHYITHMAEQHGKTLKKFPCNKCESSFTTTSSMRRHIRDKHKVMNRGFRCQFCGEGKKTFSSRALLERHVQLRHSMDTESQDTLMGGGDEADSSSEQDGSLGARRKRRGPVKMEQDDESTGGASPLKKLQPSSSAPASYSLPESGFRCAPCGFTTEDQASFLEHISQHRRGGTEGGGQQCLQCGACFTSTSSLSRHRFIIHKVRNASDNQQSLSVHPAPSPGNSRNHDDKSSLDGSAPASPSSQSSIAQGMEEDGTLACKVCGKQFEKATDLNTHFRTHGMAFISARNAGKTT